MSWPSQSLQTASTSSLSRQTISQAGGSNDNSDGLGLDSAHRLSQSQHYHPHQNQYSLTSSSNSSGHGSSSTLLNSTSGDNSLQGSEKRVGNVLNNDKRVMDGLHRASLASRPTPTAPSMFAASSSPPHSTSLELPPWPPSPQPEETRKRNWFAVYDPALDPKKSKGKDIIYRYDGKPETVPGAVNTTPFEVKDPRIEAKKLGKDLTGRGMRKCRSAFYTLEWEVR